MSRSSRFSVHAVVFSGLVSAAVVGVGLARDVSAGGSGSSSSFVAITPCRLFDTRPAPDNVGGRSTPIGPNDTFVATVRGANGNCNIPASATAVSFNVSIIHPSAASFLTVYPSDATRPLTANLTYVGGQAPTPNAVTAALSADGKVGFYNLSGSVDVAADVVGYFQPADTSPNPLRVVWVAPSGTNTFSSVSQALASITDASSTNPYVIRIAPGTYSEPNGIVMKDYVSLVGSGRTDTVLTSTGSIPKAATIFYGGSQHGEIRDLAIVNTGGSALGAALGFTDVVPDGGVRITGVDLTSSGTSNTGRGVYVSNAGPVFTDVTATVTGGVTGIAFGNDNSRSVMTNVTATATGGSVLSTAFRNINGATPKMSNIVAVAGGAPGNRGVDIDAGSSVAIDHLKVTVTGPGGSGTAFVDGIRVVGTATLHDVTVSVSGAGTFGSAYAMYSEASGAPTVDGLTATAAGNSSYALALFNTSTMAVSFASLSGDVNAVAIDDTAGLTLSQSVLVAGNIGGAGSGTRLCRDVVNAAGTLLSTGC